LSIDIVVDEGGMCFVAVRHTVRISLRIVVATGQVVEDVEAFQAERAFHKSATCSIDLFTRDASVNCLLAFYNIDWLNENRIFK